MQACALVSAKQEDDVLPRYMLCGEGVLLTQPMPYEGVFATDEGGLCCRWAELGSAPPS